MANIELHSLSPSPFPCQPLHSGTAGSTRLFCGSLSGHEERSRDVSLSTEPARLLPHFPQRHGIPRGNRAGLGAVSPWTLLLILLVILPSLALSGVTYQLCRNAPSLTSHFPTLPIRESLRLEKTFRIIQSNQHCLPHH